MLMKRHADANWKKWISLFVLLVISLFMPVLLSNYQMTLVNGCLINVLLVVGVNFIIGYTGELSFAQSGFWCIGAYVSGLLMTKLGMPYILSFLLAILASAFVALCFGYAVLRLKGHYFAVATLGFTEIIRQIALNWKPMTGGGDGLKSIPRPDLFGFTFQTKQEIYYLLVAIVIIALFISFRIEKSKYGRAFMSIRESDMAAAATGIDVARYKIIAFVLAAAFAGAAGSLYASVYSYISPDIFSTHESTTFVIMLLVGGIGNIWGAAIGAIVLTLLPESLRVFANYYMIIYGFGILLILIFMPKGVVGLALEKYQAIRKRRMSRREGALENE